MVVFGSNIGFQFTCGIYSKILESSDSGWYFYAIALKIYSLTAVSSLLNIQTEVYQQLWLDCARPTDE